MILGSMLTIAWLSFEIISRNCKARLFQVNLLSLAFYASINPTPSYATLGEIHSSHRNASSSKHQKSMMTSTEKTSSAEAVFTVHETIQNGINLKEYVSVDGIIFGASWTGYSHPDLSLLLGTYLQEYSDQTAASKKGLGRSSHFKITGDNVIVEKSGHMRALQGRAYIPSLIPNGVNSNEIK